MKSWLKPHAVISASDSYKYGTYFTHGKIIPMAVFYEFCRIIGIREIKENMDLFCPFFPPNIFS